MPARWFQDPELLVLDESTSALDVQTRDNLFAILRERAVHGRSTIFISHRMDEITDLVDRAVVLRSGTTVGELAGADITPDALVQLMTGSGGLVHLPASAARDPSDPNQRSVGLAPVVLSVRQLRLASGARPVDFEVREGEIVGLAGLEGHGQDAFLNRLAAGSARGEITAHRGAAAVKVTSRRTALDLGLAFVPRDRRAQGIFSALSTLENFSAATLTSDRKAGLLSTVSGRRRSQASWTISGSRRTTSQVRLPR